MWWDIINIFEKKQLEKLSFEEIEKNMLTNLRT